LSLHDALPIFALPAIMADVGVGVDQLQAATPIISGFLLGYIVVMPLLGRLSDIHGRRPLLLLCLTVFAAGSLVTASAHDLGSVVAGRALQGLGGGGLVPVTLALVADLWPPDRRGVPLGVIGGVQELGSVLGPLYGGLILTVASWQTIFWLNLPIAAALGAGLFVAGRRTSGADVTAERPAAVRPGVDTVSIGLTVLALGAGCLAIVAPEPLRNDATVGLAYSALGGLVWLTPLALFAAAAAAVLVLWDLRERTSTRPLIGVRRIPAVAREVDAPGAALLAVALATVIVSFAAEDPTTGAISPAAVWLLPLGAISCLPFV